MGSSMLEMNSNTEIFTVSIGICAYNEEKNIGKLLDALLKQTSIKLIKEIIVISSGSTDKTNDIVLKYANRNDKIKLIIQKERKGKASAVNLFLKEASGDIAILISADVIPANDAIEKLIMPFLDPKIGITGPRVIPVNDKKKFIGFVVHLLWDLHHELSFKYPKFGEMIAFRNIIKMIDEHTSVDEAWIESLMINKGYKLKYVDTSVVFNKGAETISDFIKQRRRIHAGHIDLKKRAKYNVPTAKLIPVAKLALSKIIKNPSKIHWVVGAIILEAYTRLLGMWDYYIKKKRHVIWDIAESTKNLKDNIKN